MILHIKTKGRVKNKGWRGNCEIQVRENGKKVSMERSPE